MFAPPAPGAHSQGTSDYLLVYSTVALLLFSSVNWTTNFAGRSHCLADSSASSTSSSTCTFAIEKRVPLRQMRLEGQRPATCDDLCAGAEMLSGEQHVFFVDQANSCVKTLAISSTGAWSCRVAYRSPTPDTSVPRAARFVPGPDVLFVVEALLSSKSRRKKHFLLATTRQASHEAAAEGRADVWQVAQRERLTTTPVEWDEERFVQLHALPDGRLFFGMSKSNQLELFDVSPSAAAHVDSAADSNTEKAKQLRAHASLRLYFKFFCFALGVVDSAALLFAAVDGEAFVRILRLSDASACGAPAAQPVRFVEADASRLQWLGSPDGRSGRLLCAEWKERAYVHAVDVWRVADGGRRTECACSALSTGGIDIDCWCALANSNGNGNGNLLLNNLHRAELVLARCSSSE